MIAGRIVDFHPDAADLRTLASAILDDLEAVVAQRIGQERFEIMRDGLAADWGAPPKP